MSLKNSIIVSQVVLGSSKRSGGIIGCKSTGLGGLSINSGEDDIYTILPNPTRDVIPPGTFGIGIIS